MSFQPEKYPNSPIENGDKVILGESYPGDRLLYGCRAIVSNISLEHEKADVIIVDDLVHNGMKQNNWPLAKMRLFQKKIQ